MGQSRTYTLPADETLSELAAKIRAADGPNIDPTQATGKATAYGVSVSWVVNAGKIILTIQSKPFLIPASIVWEHAASFFSGAA